MVSQLQCCLCWSWRCLVQGAVRVWQGSSAQKPPLEDRFLDLERQMLEKLLKASPASRSAPQHHSAGHLGHVVQWLAKS